MRPESFDPTAGARARAIREQRWDSHTISDATAGERARQIHRRGQVASITDPTDPRVGQARDSDRPPARRRAPHRPPGREDDSAAA
jgi:hypothetical protein